MNSAISPTFLRVTLERIFDGKCQKSFREKKNETQSIVKREPFSLFVPWMSVQIECLSLCWLFQFVVRRSEGARAALQLHSQWREEWGKLRVRSCEDQLCWEAGSAAGARRRCAFSRAFFFFCRFLHFLWPRPWGGFPVGCVASGIPFFLVSQARKRHPSTKTTRTQFELRAASDFLRSGNSH